MNNQILTLLVLLFVAFNPLKAQTNDDKKSTSSSNPWTVGFGVNAIDYTSVEPIFGGFFDANDWNAIPTISKLTFGKQITSGLNWELSHSLSRINSRPELNATSRRYINDADLNIKLGIGKLISDNAWFDPYLIAGGGMVWERRTGYGNANGGAGLGFWLNDNWGIYAQSVYDWMPDTYPNFFTHSAGVNINIGGKKADMDGDGIADDKDKCPNTAGVRALSGCPDADSDGVMDGEDKCPNDAGKVGNMGCPDTDGDGIHDGDDKCIDKAGTVEFEGCPDTDGDGISDNNDKCPEEKGLEENDGCPEKDADNDGILDKNDKCPNVAGVKSAQGCPDKDGDGFADDADACPTIKGTIGGCPDSDADGVADNIDKCPKVKGAAQNAGCPVVKEPVIDKVQVEQQLNFNAKAINFESGSDVIKTSSYGVLDNIVGIMNKYPKAKFSIEGHTDSQGNDANNLSLSQRRAIAVVNYFMKKGIVGSRISAAGFGETQPIADNNTAEGRATNRRVEIKLK